MTININQSTQRMKLKMFINGKMEQDTALFGANGQLRFKSKFAKVNGFVAGERWLVGTDEEEDQIKYIYVVKDLSDKKRDRGWVMSYQNKSWFISAKMLMKQLSITKSTRMQIEPFEDSQYKGMRLILPTPVTTKL